VPPPFLCRMPSATSRSTPRSLSPPDICAPPSDPSPSPTPKALEPPPTPKALEPPDWWTFPAGAPQRRPPSTVCIINRSEEISCEGQALDLALLALVGGSRPFVSVAEVERWLEANYTIAPSSVTIRSFYPEDFLVVLSSYGDMSRVLHQPPSSPAAFSLVFKRWSHQLQASTGKLLFQVVVRLTDILAHAWSVSMAS
jgi:hypothetical protein